MGKDAVLARQKAVQCMTLAANARTEERSAVLMAMARSWITLANQMDRLEATRAKAHPGKRRGRAT
jgi:hypothetical protein